MQEVGFKNSKEYKLWEIRKTYKIIDDLITDILNRTGRSILYELTNKQLEDLVVYIKKQVDLKNNEPIIEKDRWTIWKALKQ